VALVPRWLREPTRFDELGAVHLPRPAVGKLSRLYRTTLWSYAERSLFAALTAGYALLQALRGRYFDVAYVRDTVAAFWWASVWGKALGIPVVYEAHDLEGRNPSRAKEAGCSPLRAMDRGRPGKRARRLPHRRLPPPARGKKLRDPPPWPSSPTPSTTSPFARDAAAARRAWASPADRLVVYAGLTFTYRRLELLLQALVALRPRHPALRLVFVGGRPAELASLRDEAARLGVGDAVTFVGPRPQGEVALYLQAADLLALPDAVTDVTASPLKLFEYLATARAVVLPDIPALQEILPAEVGYYAARRRGTSRPPPQRACRRSERREDAGRAAVRPFVLRRARILPCRQAREG
jgi:glycosyltransferase involved in cell wall biosynthesis